MNYSYSKESTLGFNDLVQKTIEALSKEGFGILTRVDVKKTLKEKLNIDYDEYVILGACNPPLAHKALEIDKEVGLFLPCNVIVYQDKDKVKVSAILPSAAMSLVDNDDLKKIAQQAEEKFKRVIDSL